MAPDAPTPASTSQGPRFPSTLAPEAYYDGLVPRFQSTVLPSLAPFFTSLPAPTSPGRPVRVLELASGNGTHALLYAREFAPQGIELQPSECDEWGCERVDALVAQQQSGGERARVRKAVKVDVLDEGDWEALSGKAKEEGTFDLVLGQNFVHMIPFPSGPRAIFRSLLAHKLVSPSRGKLVFYGPFKHDAGFFSPSDESFNAHIAARPSPYPLGLRSLDELKRIAREEGWDESDRVAVEANGNWVVAYRVA
ncbi:uncharacterized protein JCM10292_000020 [Rhodotorula paludigena]|uniref:uncharacterized protein n=1 Tax=Rhodotorula paludigena TaxID=86838 RepID=UPI003170041C